MCAVPEASPNVRACGDQNAVHLNGGKRHGWVWWGWRWGTKETEICNSHEGRVRLTGQSELSAKGYRMPTRAVYYLLSLSEFRCLPQSSDASAKIAKSYG